MFKAEYAAANKDGELYKDAKNALIQGIQYFIVRICVNDRGEPYDEIRTLNTMYAAGYKLHSTYPMPEEKRTRAYIFERRETFDLVAEELEKS